MCGSMSPSERADEEADWTFMGRQLAYSHKQAVIIITITKMHLHHLILWFREVLSSIRDSEKTLTLL